MDDSNKNILQNHVRNVYYGEGCGICEREGADVFWFNPKSRRAHKACFELVKELEDDVCEQIKRAFPSNDNGDINFAHVEVVKAVMGECKCTLLSTGKRMDLKH